MKRIIYTILIAIIPLLALSAVPAYAYDPFQGVCNDPSSNAYSSAVCQGQRSDTSQNPLTGKNGILRGIANIIAITAGIAAVILIIIGGMRYITSGGDPAKVKSAKDTIIAAIIGIVIIAVADGIISLVLSRI